MVTYPLAAPDALRFATVEVGRVSTSGVNTSPYSMGQEVYQWPGQGWLLSVTLPANADVALQRVIDGFVAALDGRFGTFRMALPDRDPNPAITVNPTAGADAAARAGSLTVQHAGATGFAVGDVFEVDGRLYLVTVAGAISEGAQVVDIWPRLRAAVTSGDPIEAMDPQGLWRLADDRQGYNLDLVYRANTLKFVEAQ